MSDLEKLFATMAKSNVYFGEEPEEEYASNDKLQRRPSVYKPPQPFSDDNDFPMQFFCLSATKEVVPKKVIRKPSRESIANGLNIVAKSIKFSDIKVLRPVPLTLVSCGVKIMRVPQDDEEERQLICDLEICQLKVSTFDRIQAFDLSLLIADYQYYIRNQIKSAITHLEQAASYVPNNIRLYIEILEKAQELSEEIEDYEHALKIEPKLDKHDIAFDWKDRRRQKKIELREKIMRRDENI